MKLNANKELHWLWKSNKDLSMPIVVEKHALNVSGYYRHPQPEERIYDDLDFVVPKNTGVIVVDFDDLDNAKSALAHEFRHHWQMYNHINLCSTGWAYVYNLTNNYEESIRRFFYSCDFEMDAYKYTCEVASSELTDYWAGLLEMRI
jgi:hypothetical protein